MTVFRNKWVLMAAGFTLGALSILGIRLATYRLAEVHYHANFAVYVNEKKEDFKNPLNYEEIEMCSLKTGMAPKQRAHMHDNVNNVVHVEDHAVTWGHFLTNLGWYMGPTFIVSPDGVVYPEEGDNRLNLVLNGKNYTGLGGLANRVINDQDKMLVSYGNVNSNTLQKEYKDIPATAGRYDATKDPNSCSGHDSLTMRDRFKHIF